MKEKTTKQKIIFAAVGIALALLSFFLTYNQVFYSFDKMISDPLYQQSSSTNRNIRILAIDEATLAAYGDMTEWSRGIYADLINKLNSSEDTKPAVITLDILFASGGTDEGDLAFAEAVGDSNNVVVASNLVYRDKVTLTERGTLVVDEDHIEMVEYAYDALKQVTTSGFANTYQDNDGYIRFARTTATFEDGTPMDSLATATYRKYCENTGKSFVLPKTYSTNNAKNMFDFTYSGKNESYEVISLVSLLNGDLDSNLRMFKDSIVFVGGYAPGLQDAFNVANQKGAQMYGVEIHANILEALMEGKTAVRGSLLLYSIAVTVLVVLFYFLCANLKVIPTTILLVAMIVLDGMTGKLLRHSGITIDIIELPIFLLSAYAYHLISNYLTEVLKRRKVVSAFKKYVAPQVVDEISKKGEFKITLGGEKRHIACLFVDIRGFTPMSEGLQPEQVVEILNEYLNLTTNSIFKNNGTLDKFIGDATMAVFNAPFDLDDYIYRAVCTARDIAAGSEELEAKLMARFGKSVSFGIGVNCGDAVVGNIGCDFRMDYTAIGDTVNTSARLEANAKRGQILISDSVYEALKDRIEVTPIGAIPLKGKSNEVFVYQLDKVL